MNTLQALLRSAEPDGDGLTWFRATSEAKDHHGTVIRAAGVDLGPFLRNPVVGWAHSAIRGGSPEDILGKVEAIDRGADHIDVGVRFASHERAQLTAELVRGGFISAVSVGILPKKTGTEKIDGVNTPVIRESELLEVSIVPVGSNPEAQRLLRDITGVCDPDSERGQTMDKNIENQITDALKPLGERLEAIEKAIDQPERKPALGGARITTPDIDALAGRWIKARAFNDHQTLLEIASKDPAPEAVVRDMLSANSYLPTQVGTQLITLVGRTSKFWDRLGRVTGDALSIVLPRESTKLTANFVAENTNVILGGAALNTVTLTARNMWAGERVPNRVLADSPISVAQLLIRQAADAFANLIDQEVVNGSAAVTSGLEDLTGQVAPLQDDTPGTSTASDFVNQVASQYFDVPFQVRPRATWVINRTYAENLSKVLDSTGRPVFAIADSAPSATIDEANPTGSRLFGRPVIVSPDVTANEAYFGDLSRALMIYLRNGIVAESSRDSEFALDNTLFRFSIRWDVAVVEATQIHRFVVA